MGGFVSWRATGTARGRRGGRPVIIAGRIKLTLRAVLSHFAEVSSFVGVLVGDA